MESMGSMGIYKNESMESMGSMVFSSILLLIISRKHGKKAWEDSMGKHGKAWDLCKLIYTHLVPIAAGFPGFYWCPGSLASPL